MARRANSNLTNSKKSSRPAASPPSSSNPKTPVDWLGMLFGPKIPGEPNQRDAARMAIAMLSGCGGYGILSDPGTGKTIVSMAIIQHFAPKRLLIVAPLTSLEVTWRKRLESLYGDIVNNIHEFTEGVLLVGFEHFRNNIKKIVRFAEKYGFDMAIVDESQGLKTRSSKQSRAMRQLRLRVPKRLILSGTPIDESPMDIWAQMRFIAPDVLGDVWSAPRNRAKYVGPYFEEDFLRPCGFMNKQREFRPEKMKEFLDRITPYLYRLPNDLEPAELLPVYKWKSTALCVSTA